MGAAEDLHLEGKDWLTEPEAAFYCGVSLRKFQMDVPELGIAARRFMGKKLYSKTELFELIEKSQPWQNPRSNGEVIAPTFRGARPANDGAALSARLMAVPLRKSGPRRKRS